MEEYEIQFKRNIKHYIKIPISKEMYNLSYNLSNRIIKEKFKEDHYIKDSYKLHQRFMTGLLGEMAVLQSLGYSIFDLETAIGNSENFIHADLQAISINNVGVKSVINGNAPIINKNNQDYQVITVIDFDSNIIYICGLATPNVLQLYSDDKYIKDKKLKARGTKTAFYGFDHIYNYRNPDEFYKFTKNKKGK